jgi:naphthoate synthase/2-ketocyclohexanecarboxyl-CoA hydrolase
VDYEDILYEVRARGGWITINRPDKLNAFREQTVEELTDAFERADLDPEVAVIVLTGAGDRAFSSGGDVGAEREFTKARSRRFVTRLMKLSQQMRGASKASIAAVKGYAVGGGNELQMLCDLTIAADNARFGQTGPRVGSVPNWYGVQLLALNVGDKRAREILYLTRQYTAEQALAMGLCNAVVPLDELVPTVDAWVAEIAAKSPTAIRIAKLSMNYLSDLSFAGVNQGLAMVQMALHTTEEQHEGMQAFLDKRPPDFDRFR